MKLIEAMKLIKELQRKAEDLRDKVKEHSANYDYETAVYPDQKRQIDEWIQAHHDILKEILKLRLAVQRTNLATKVDITIDERIVTKTIAEWIHRRRDLAELERLMWSGLTDRGLKEGGALPNTIPGTQPSLVKIRRYYDPPLRDRKIELYRNEPGIIDRTLEVVNAITDVLPDPEPVARQAA